MLKIATPAARADDPATSHEAEQRITDSGARYLQQRAVADAVHQYPGCTSRELAEKIGMDRYAVARRLPECETAGTIVRGDQRPCSAGRGSALTWWPVIKMAA